jgi:hypothetical protein
MIKVATPMFMSASTPRPGMGSILLDAALERLETPMIIAITNTALVVVDIRRSAGS